MTTDDLVLPDSLYMPRKTFEFGRDALKAAEVERSVSRLVSRPPVSGSEELLALDRYWAREHVLYRSFARHAGISYDRYLPGRSYTYRRVAALISRLLADKRSSVLDVGSGSALASRHLAGDLRAYYALDVSHAALEFARAVAEETCVRLIGMQGSGFRIPMRNNSVDVSCSLGLFEHFDETDQLGLLREMARVTRSWVVILVPNVECAIFKAMCELEETNAGGDATFPLEAHYFEVDFVRLASAAGLELIESGAVHLVPPRHLPRRLLVAEEEEVLRAVIGLASQIYQGDAMSAWWTAEDSIEPRSRNRFGWFKYAVVTASEP